MPFLEINPFSRNCAEMKATCVIIFKKFKSRHKSLNIFKRRDTQLTNKNMYKIHNDRRFHNPQSPFKLFLLPNPHLNQKTINVNEKLRKTRY